MLKFVLIPVLALVLLLHFVPVYNKSGVLSSKLSVCIGYTKPQLLSHRIITGGLSDFHKDKNGFTPTKLTNSAEISGAFQRSCAEPAELKLYVL